MLFEAMRTLKIKKLISLIVMYFYISINCIIYMYMIVISNFVHLIYNSLHIQVTKWLICFEK